MNQLASLLDLKTSRFETVPILKKLSLANRKLGEFKGIASTIPNQNILITTLGIQEAKNSSAIENIVTTQDELFQGHPTSEPESQAGKEVLNYRTALQIGFEEVQNTQLLTVNNIINIQANLVRNNAGFRKVPGTALKNNAGEIVYTPPQDKDEVVRLMSDLECFINDPQLYQVDPIIKMALIHHQFESIHPFYDGNGRTGRILNVLYLTKENLLDIPILYLSRYIVQTKAEYYRLLQLVRTQGAWEEWVLYLLDAVEKTSIEGIETIEKIKKALFATKDGIRKTFPKMYSQDLINNLFNHPYTKIEFIMTDLNVTRLTASNYLENLVKSGFLIKHKIGRSNYYINHKLVSILTEN